MLVPLRGPNWVLNDLKLASPRCSYWKYVDDITIIIRICSAHEVSFLQSGNISTWAATNNIVLNPKKCKEMTLRFRRAVDHLPSALAIDTKALESVDAHQCWVFNSKQSQMGFAH